MNLRASVVLFRDFLVYNVTMFLGYIGPGAGFAFLGSFLILFVAILLAMVSVLLFPLRVLIATLRGRRRMSGGKAKRVVVIGMDGMDPKRTSVMMNRGDLPNFSKLAEKGMFSELQSTCPPISPVAWSTFSTGVNPGKHNIFDFLSRDLKTRIPELSSCRISATEATLLRKSKTFWQVLGEHGIFSTVLRVPITFPAEKFNGLMLSAMCVPDLRGTQGTFTLYETDRGEDAGQTTGGLVIKVPEGTRIDTHLPGPQVGDKELRVKMRIDVDAKKDAAQLCVSGTTTNLKKGEYSDWVRLTFRQGFKKAYGICRFLLVSTEPNFKLYVTPINIDPEHPSLPISHPMYYSIYLAKLHGPFATLGLAEDTWGLNEGAISEEAFLQQVYDIENEREEMFLDALKRTRRGLCCCVFDLTDRIQHMFGRHADHGHPARTVKDDVNKSAIDDAYRRMDDLLGKATELIDDETALFVLSDHGFGSFRRGVNLNAWLEQEGYLVRKPDMIGNEYLTDVDWTKTRAYAFGLSGIYFNLNGREADGIVDPGDERAALKKEIIGKLDRMIDPETDEIAIHGVYDNADVYKGPYCESGPDVVVGFAEGYRASWETAVGSTGGPIFADNTKNWSGDHCVDRDVVPGVLFANRVLEKPDGNPGLQDMGPTILDLFGIETPKYMDGAPLVEPNVNMDVIA